MLPGGPQWVEISSVFCYSVIRDGKTVMKRAPPERKPGGAVPAPQGSGKLFRPVTEGEVWKLTIAYGITAFVSLCMLGVCVLADKKRDVWLLLVFVSVSVCNLGYFMLSISGTLEEALNANRIAYLGNVFLPFFVLMMVLRFSGIRRNNALTLALVAIGIVMLAITTSPGILPYYYSTVAIAAEAGGTRLVREYGPLHMLYSVYLIGYMISMVAVVFYAIIRQKIRSRSRTFLLVCTVFCNIIIWAVEQFLPRGFEWLSVSYIVTESLILILCRSMQRQGLADLNGRPQSYTVNVLLSIFLLLFASFVRVATRDTAPAMYLAAQLVVLAIYVAILVGWGASVHDRIVNKTMRRYLITMVGLMMLWMLMRTLRLTVFYRVFPVGQWCWYAYYIGMILIPQTCLFAAKYIGKPEEYRLPKKWYFMYLPSLMLIFGILTNDLHQWAFRFHLGYEAGWDEYQHSFLYFAAAVWIFVCIAMMIIQTVRSCRIPGTKKKIWFPVAILGIGVLYTVLYPLDSDLFGFIELTAALCFTMVGIWESCIKTGLIPSNSHNDELLQRSGLGVAVVDQSFAVHYRSDDARMLTKEQMQTAVESPVMLSGGIRVSGSKIRGGYALWQEDLSELLDLLDDLEILREELKDSNAVSMQNYQMDKRMRALAEKNRLHDELTRQTARQIDRLDEWLKAFLSAGDRAEKRELLRRIVVVGAYLKRRNNLILVSEQDRIIKAEELELSVAEMIRNLQLTGVTCASSVELDRDIPAETVMELLDFYEYVVEGAFDGLQSLLARFFNRGSSFYCCVDAVCSFDLSGFAGDGVMVSIAEEDHYTLAFRTEGGGCL